jgi:protein TonB
MKKAVAILAVFVVAKLMADGLSVPPLTEPFEVRVTLSKPSEQFRGANIAKPIHQVFPEFPIEMREAKIEGVVEVSFVVEANGLLTAPTILSPSNKVFEDSVLNALKMWRFKPAQEKGKSVAMKLVYVIRFSLPQEEIPRRLSTK